MEIKYTYFHWKRGKQGKSNKKQTGSKLIPKNGLIRMKVHSCLPIRTWNINILDLWGKYPITDDAGVNVLN